MKKLFHFLVFVIISVLTIGCSKQEKIASDKGRIIGTWQWERSVGGVAFQLPNTPESTGINMELKLSSNGNFAMITNGIVVKNGTYALETRKCIHDRTDKTYINFSAGLGLMIEKVDIEYLEVSMEVRDGVASSYRRKSFNGN